MRSRIWRASDAGLGPTPASRRRHRRRDADMLPRCGVVVTLLRICGPSHRKGYRDLAIAGHRQRCVAVVAMTVLGSTFGSL
jgi:hypothetical protein